jgi:hypothetical protein
LIEGIPDTKGGKKKKKKEAKEEPDEPEEKKLKKKKSKVKVDKDIPPPEQWNSVKDLTVLESLGTVTNWD